MKKNLFVFLIILFIPLFFVACSNDKKNDFNGEKLSTPNLPYFENNLIYWEPVYNAKSYILNINGTEYSLITNQAPITIDEQEKQYNIKVKAIGDNKTFGDSDYSETLILNSHKLLNPTIQRDFELNRYGPGDLGEHGQITLSLGENVDYIKVWVNDIEYKYDVQSSYQLTILKEMCVAGENIIKIQSFSNNKLYLPSGMCTTTINKLYKHLNVISKNGKIYYTIPDLNGNPTNEVEYKRYISGLGDIVVPVINYTTNNALNSDAVNFNTYRLQGIDSSSLLVYHENKNGSVDFYLIRKFNNSSEGNDYNSIKIIFYDRGGKPLYTFPIFAKNDPNIDVDFGMSNFNTYNIGKVTATLINSEKPEYLTTEIEIELYNTTIY